MRTLLALGLAAILPLLASCNRLFHHDPPARILAGCPAIMFSQPLPQGSLTFADLRDELQSRGWRFEWETSGTDAGVLRGTRVDPLTHATTRLAFQLAAVPSTDQQCPGGATVITELALNDQVLGPHDTDALLNDTMNAARLTAAARRPPEPQTRQPPLPDLGNTTTASPATPAPTGADDTEVNTASANLVTPPPASLPIEPLASSEVPRALARGIIVSDDRTWCCLTVGQLAKFFMTDGGSAMLGSSGSDLVVSVVDPRGRWNGWHQFQLRLSPDTGSSVDTGGALVRPTTVTVTGQTVLTDDPSADKQISPSLRDLFHLTGTELANVDFGPAYKQCSTTGLAAEGSDSAARSCLAEEFSRRDLVLNHVYGAKMGSLTPDRQEALRTAERAWLRERGQRCANPTDGGTLNAVQAAYCAVALTIQRTNDIQRFR